MVLDPFENIVHLIFFRLFWSKDTGAPPGPSTTAGWMLPNLQCHDKGCKNGSCMVKRNGKIGQSFNWDSRALKATHTIMTISCTTNKEKQKKTLDPPPGLCNLHFERFEPSKARCKSKGPPFLANIWSTQILMNRSRMPVIHLQPSIPWIGTSRPDSTTPKTTSSRSWWLALVVRSKMTRGLDATSFHN